MNSAQRVYGLDFGTTNSLIALVDSGVAVPLLDQGEHGRPHPSVVAFVGGQAITGRPAKDLVEQAGLEVRDNIVPAPKRLLLSPHQVTVAGEAMDAEDIVGVVLRGLREHAADLDHDVNRVVMTIPVSMDGRARRRLRQAAARQGLEIVQYVHEPLAALYGFLRSHDDFEVRLSDLADGLVLVVDWGGGTLDLTLCTYVDGMLLQVQSLGDDRVGGDRFDEALLNLVVKRHLQAHGLSEEAALAPGARQKLMARCELAKIQLSSRDSTSVVLDNCFDTPGKAATLAVSVDRSDLLAATNLLVQQGVGAVERLLAASHHDIGSVRRCLLVGGMGEMPAIRARLARIFDVSRIEAPAHGDRLIAEGAAWIAHDDLRLSLAKPFELRLARGALAEIAPPLTLLPRGGTVSQDHHINLFCADPRDGAAVLDFMRPLWPGQASLTDERASYVIKRIPVDSEAGPMMERIDVTIRFTEDLTAEIVAESASSGARTTDEVHDLEFGLRLPASADTPDARAFYPFAGGSYEIDDLDGAVLLRANIARHDHWSSVPGDLFRQYRKDADMTQEQRAEALYYQACSACGLTIAEVRQSGGCQMSGCSEKASATTRLR